MKTKWKWESGLIWVLFLGASLRILFYLIADNNGGDAISRAYRIDQWMAHPTFAGPDPLWGPVYFYITGPLGFLLKDPELAGRLLSMACGIGSLYFVYRLTSILGGKSAGLMSGLVCVFSGIHIGYSTTSSSEMSYLFFLLAGFAGFFEYKTSGRLVPLALGGVCYTIATGIRYEGWIFLPLLGLILIWPPKTMCDLDFWSSKRASGLLLFILLFGAWPIIWSGYSLVKWHDPIYAVHLNGTLIHQIAAESIRPASYRLSLPIGVLFFSLSPLPLAGSLYAIVKCWKRPLPRQFIVLSLGFALVQYLQIWRAAVISNARYTLTLFILCAVLSGLGISEFQRSQIKYSTRQVEWLIFGTMILTQIGIWAGSESRMPLNEKLASISPRLRYAHYIEDAAIVLRPRLVPTDAVIIDSYNWEDNIFSHALGLPLNPARRDASIDSTVPSGYGQNVPRWSGDPQSLGIFIRICHPRFLVYSDEGVMKPYLNLPERCIANESLGEMRLHCFYSNSIYRLYEVQYSSDEKKDTP